MTTKAEERRQRIIDAGVQLFARHGVKSTRLADIATRSKLAKATLYYYFPEGKETIFSAAIERVVTKIYDDFAAEVLVSDDPLEQLRAYTHGRVRIFDDELHARGVTPAVWEELKPMADRVLDPFFAKEFELVRGIFSRGVDAGLFRGVNPATAATLLTITLRGLTADGPFPESPEQRMREVNLLFEVITRGLLLR